ncbi:UNVERIFIED_CONTAM: hypothetical protein GTU68_035414 [Idotea baltica]|nr:hypothetical protein [Idotea baltica]
MSSPPRIAVILSGCGVYDGAEIHESVLTLLRLDQREAQVQCFAPNIKQKHVVNHLTGQSTEEERNVMIESARITRGAINAVTELTADQYDALIIPGGFGVAKNLSSFAEQGAECSIQADFLAAVRSFVVAKKPIGLICITPALTAKLIGKNVHCTIGADAESAALIEKMGAIHHNCKVEDIIEDKHYKLVSTPAYMLATSINQAAIGINKLVDRVLELI